MNLALDHQATLKAGVPPAVPVLRVLFWVAGGPSIGMGHVMRSLELARSLEEAGICVVGFVRNDHPVTRAAIVAAGRPTWLEWDERVPPAEVVLVDRPTGVDDKVLAWRAGRPGLRLAALDSFDMEGGHADLVINLINHHPLLLRPSAQRVRYREGPEYAIIRREFMAARERPRQIPVRAREVIVSFGGADPSNHTGLVLEALAAARLDSVIIRVVIGPAFAAGASTVALARRQGLEVLEGAADLAPWFGAADLAVSGGGTTMLELACTGTPTLVLPQNAAEGRFAASLAARGAVCLGTADAGAVRRELELLVNDQPARKRLSTMAQAAVDGFGCRRIAESLLATFKPFIC